MKTKIIKTAITVLLLIILAFNLLIIKSEQEEDAGILNNLPLSIIPVAGSSMEPYLSPGDAILTTNAPFYSIKVGDVIVYARSGDLITHQVIERSRESLVTKGIANKSEDSPAVSLQEYKAKVVCKIPLLGSLWRIGSSPLRLSVLALLLVLIVFGKDIFSAIYTKLFDK